MAANVDVVSDSEPVESYNNSTDWLHDFFHDFPHVNFKFQTVNATFNPDSEDYNQAVAFWTLVPAAICFLLLLFFLVYFIFRCCQAQGASKRQTCSCAQIFTGLLTFIGVALLCYGFYENEKAHHGVSRARGAMANINTTILTASNRVESLDSIAKAVATNVSDELEQAVSGLNETYHDKAMKLINHIRTEGNSIRGYLDKIDMPNEDKMHDVIGKVHDVEYLRWSINIVIYCLCILMLLMALIGLIIKSRGLLIVSTTLAVIFSVLIWVTSGLYLSVSMALGDLCVDPDSYIIGLTEHQISEDVVRAYILCTDVSQPYQQEITNAQTSVSQAITDLNKTVVLLKPFHIPQLDKPVKEMTDYLQFAMGNLSALLINVGRCTTLHNMYIGGINSVCHDTIQATALLALISIIMGVIITIIVFTMSCAWRKFSKKRLQPAYVPVDDTDPFLPRPPQYDLDYGTMGHSSPRPWSERGALQPTSAANTGEHTAILNHLHPFPEDESPPPAYYPGKFVQQYNESGPFPSSMRSQENN